VLLLGTAGFVVALLSTSVSFLEDQTLGNDLSGAGRTAYYERVQPPPGRPWNRYRIAYIPFAQTMMSDGWLHDSTYGLGPDYFPNHLRQARTQMLHGSTIPLWLIWGWPAGWLTVLAVAATRIVRNDLRRQGF
jgi:hypothetical protein